MKINAIVQARMGSKRLPGKVMLEVKGKPLIGYLIDRLKQCKEIDQIIVASPECDKGSHLHSYLNEQKITAYFGEPENDLCARFLAVLKYYPCDAFVRICGDSPLIEPTLVDELAIHLKTGSNIASNVGLKTIPPGHSAEGVLTDFYREICENCRPEDREHAGFPHVYREVAKYNSLVDTAEDFERVKAMIERGALVATH